jgi:ACS family allantoate permease-like MFS transporter
MGGISQYQIHINNHKLTSPQGLYLITVPYVLALFLAWSLIPSNVAGRTKKTIISSCTFLGYCVGNMAGSQIFKDADKPRYSKLQFTGPCTFEQGANTNFLPPTVPGTIGAAVSFGIQFVLIVCWRLYYVWQNRRRDKKAAESGISKAEQERLGRELGEVDTTDLQNPHFRYSL